MRCLVVDDDESPRRLITTLIERSGHIVVAVANGRAATAMAAREAFDIAVVDLEMPGQSGTDTIAELRRLCPGTRVLVVSGYDDRRHVLAALDAGADGYLVKDELAESLGSSLQSVRAGYTPLSPRVAGVMLRALRKSLPRPPVEARAVGRIKPRRRPELAEGTGPVACLDPKKPLSE